MTDGNGITGKVTWDDEASSSAPAPSTPPADAVAPGAAAPAAARPTANAAGVTGKVTWDDEAKPAAPTLKKPQGYGVMDIPKNVLGGLVHGAGSLVKGVGELSDNAMPTNTVAAVASAVSGEDVGAKLPRWLKKPGTIIGDAIGNPIQKAGEAITGTESQAAKDTKAAPLVEGELLHPSTWKFGEGASSPMNWALKGANMVGEMAPMVIGSEATGARVLSKVPGMTSEILAAIRGGKVAELAPEAQAVAAQAMKAQGRGALAGGAAAGGVQGAEDSAQAESDRIAQMPEEELANVPAYKQMIDRGMKPEDARAALADQVRTKVFNTSLPIATAAAGVTALPLLHNTQGALARVVGESTLKRMGAGAALEAPVQGAAAVGQTAAQIASANAATGESRDPLGDSLATFGAGAVPGAAFGVLGGLHRPAPQLTRPRFEEAKPGSLSDAANALPEAPTAAPAADTASNVPAQPQPTVTAEQLTGRAQRRLDALNRAAEGTAETQMTDREGKPYTVPGEQKRLLTDAELEERAFLTQNIGDPQALAKRTGATLADEAPAAAADMSMPRASDAVDAGAGTETSPRTERTVSTEPPTVPWIDTTTGEVRKPSSGEMVQALADRLVWQFDTQGHMRTSTKALASEWGVSPNEISEARKVASKVAARRVRSSEVTESVPVASDRAQRAMPEEVAKPSADAAAPAEQTQRAKPAAESTASVPFMITKATREGLRELGHTDADIAKMTPAKALETLQAGERAPQQAEAFPDDAARIAEIGKPGEAQAQRVDTPSPAPVDTPASAGARGTAPAEHVRTAFDDHPEKALGLLSDDEIRAVAKAAGKKYSPKASAARIVENLTGGARTDVQAQLRPALEQVLAARNEGAAPIEPAAPRVDAPAGEAPAGKVEYPQILKGQPEKITQAQRAVVDHMNGELSRDELRQRFADLEMSTGEVNSVTDRIQWTNGDKAAYADVMKQRAAAKDAPPPEAKTNKAETAAEAPAAAGTLDSYLSEKNPRDAGRIRTALDKQVRFDGKDVMSIRDRIESLHKAGTLETSTFEEPKIKPMSRTAFNRADNAQQRAHERKMKEAGNKTVYLVNDTDLGKTAYDYAEHLKQSGVKPDAKGEPDTGASLAETKAIGEALKHPGDENADGVVHHLFDPPTKAEITRMQDKVNAYVAEHGWMTPEQAAAKVEEWKAHAAAQGKTHRHENGQKVVLSLFDRTGAWSQPWEDAGYEVHRFDIQTDADVGDVHKFSVDHFNDWFASFEGKEIHTILAACPCTDFASSGARHFAAKDADGRTIDSIKLVHQTLATIEYFKPATWMLENPVGRIEKLTGLPPWRLSFDPNAFGDDYTKKTLIWGRFNADLPVAPVDPVQGSKMHRLYGGKSEATKNARSVTPEGFAYAMFMANNAVDHPVDALANRYDRLDRGVIADAVKAGLSESEISDAVDDHYYMSMDDEGAAEALREAIAEHEPTPPKGDGAPQGDGDSLEARASALAPKIDALSDDQARAGLRAIGETKAKALRDPHETLRNQHPDDIEEALKAALVHKVDTAAAEAASSPHNDLPEPTDAEKQAGNYKKGHVRLHGMDISIENPRGSERSGVGEDGKPWSHEMTDHYGYIKRTEGADGDHVDAYIGPNPDSEHVFVVDQTNQKNGGFDEHKVMLGYESQDAAIAAYKKNFDPGWKVGPVHAMDMAEFKGWLKDGDTSKPMAEHKAKTTEAAAQADATHADPGESPEATTPAVITESLKKQAANTQVDIRKAKAKLLGEVDAAMKTVKEKNTPRLIDKRDHTTQDSIDAALKAREQKLKGIGYVTFDVPGDGKFKVLRTQESLQRFRDQVEKSAGFRPQRDAGVGSSAPSANKVATIRAFIADCEPGNLHAYAEAIGQPLRYGLDQRGEPIAFALTEDVTIAGHQMFVGYDGEPGGSRWSVVDPKSGDALGKGGKTKTAAIDEAKASAKRLKDMTLAQASAKRAEQAMPEGQREAAWLKKHVVDTDDAAPLATPVPEVAPVAKPEAAKPEAKPSAPKRGGLTTSGAMARVVGGKLEYVPHARETLEAYFQPDRVVKGYAGYDKVLKFEWLGDSRWRVQVQEVNKDGTPLAVGPRSAEGMPRWHSTQADSRELLSVLGQPELAPKQAKAEPVATTEKAPEPTPTAASAFDTARTAFDAVAEGKGSVEDVQAAFARIRDEKPAVLADLGKLTKDALQSEFGLRPDSKDRMVTAAYRRLLDRATLGTLESYTISGDYDASHLRAVQGAVDKLTPADLEARAAYVKEMRDRVEARAAGIENPQTLEDYQRAAYSKGGEKFLTPEQRVVFDRLRVEKRAEDRAKETERAAVVKAVDTSGTGMRMVETKHTRDGHDLFVVKMEERVERDVYDQLNRAAKQLGGYYSSFKGNGAEPGFQFKSRESAEKFMALREGDQSRAGEMAQRADEKREARSETLAEKASKLRERAEASLSRDRKDNTARRAAQAASAEGQARADIALANTMDRIAQAQANGTAGLLDPIRHRSQVELLERTLKNASWDHLRDLGMGWEKTKDEPVAADHLIAAQLPQFRMTRDQLVPVVRKLLETRGGKQLGTELLKQIDYGDEYGQAVRDNPLKLLLQRTDGGLAMFPTKKAAETVLARSADKVRGVVVKMPAEKAKDQTWAVALAPDLAIERKLWMPDSDKAVDLNTATAEKLRTLLGSDQRESPLPYWVSDRLDRRAEFARMGIGYNFELREALRQYLALRDAPAGEDKVRKLERAIQGNKSIGHDFFPTPPALARRLVDRADIQPGMRVLEPSAGKGDIADAIRDGSGAHVDTVEMSPSLREILEAKGHHVAGHDFNDFAVDHAALPVEADALRSAMTDARGEALSMMRNAERWFEKGDMRGAAMMVERARRVTEYTPFLKASEGLAEKLDASAAAPYDRIVMNPPFSNGLDGEHVMRAYDMLKPGGRLVAITGEGIFGRGDKKAVAFRDWLAKVQGTDEKLPEGSFKSSFNPTGVNTRLVVIDKPGGIERTRSARDGESLAHAYDLPEPKDSGESPSVAKLREVHDVVREATAAWGENQPNVRVVHSPELLPEAAKADPRYRSARGLYDGDTVFLVASNLRGRDDVLRTLGHEAIGHYGMDRVVNDALGHGAWEKISATIDNLRQNPERASDGMRRVLSEVERRYRTDEGPADATTFAKEFMAVSAEKGIRSSMFDKVVTAVRAFLRKLLPNLSVGESELRHLLARSEDYVRSDGAAERAPAEAAPAFSNDGHDPNKTVPVTTIPGGKFGEVSSPEGRRIARQGAFEYLEQMRRKGVKLTNEDTGWKIGFSGAGNRELKSYTADPSRIEALAALPALMRRALLAKSEPVDPAKKVDVSAFHYFYAPLRMGGVDHVARLVVREDSNGNFAYDLQHSQILDAKNPAAPDGRLLPAPKAGAIDRGAAGHEFTVARLREAVNSVEKPGWSWSQGSEAIDTPKFREFFGDSKVVDRYGEPMPVYHGTSEDFAIFSGQRSGDATGHDTSPLGHFFTPDRQLADRYAENASDGRPAEKRVVDAYLSIQRPYEMKLAEAQAIDSPAQARALRQRLEREGYDGIHMAEANSWIAFHSEQIKSASENRGSFDKSNPNIYFSQPHPDADPDNPRPPRKPAFTNASASIEAIHATLPKLDRSTLQAAKDWMAGKARDFEPAALGALQLRHVLELAGEEKVLEKPAKSYADLYQRMDGERNSMTIDGAAKVDALNSWARQPGAAGWLGKVRPEAEALFKFMHAVTQLGVDPTSQYERLLMRDSRGEQMPWTRQLVKERIEALRNQQRGRSGDDKTAMIEEIKSLRSLPARERAREQKYPELVAQWNALTPEAQEHFATMRDHYRAQSDALEQATIEHIQALDIPHQNKLAAIETVRRNFSDSKVEGVYFPLARFGDYWLSAHTADGEFMFAKYENAAAQQAAEKQIEAAGGTIEAKGRQDNNYRAKDAPSGTFMGDLMGILRAGNAPDKVQDEIYQMYLKALPNLSLKKHGIHRGNVAGYTDDVPRVFASSVFHGAHQISKARYGWQLQHTLEHMRETMEARRGVVDASQAAHADALLGELQKRHDWILNPSNSKLANLATSIGFTYYLGASPASALVNLIQIPQIVLPVLGAHHGWPSAMKHLGQAMKDAVRTGGNIEKTLKGEDLDAFRALQRAGTFQRTATHSLAGIAEGNQLRASPAYTRVMNGISWMFHKSEVINREGTGIAAFRLAREQGKSFAEAVKYADEMTNGTHGDYSNANRARYMQGNVQKMVLQFKNYSLAMSWLWGRNFYKAFKGESPEIRSAARRTLTGLTGMTALFAGTMGLPMFNLLRYGMEAVHAVTGDDDEPWDFDTEFRSWLADHFGEQAGQVIANGAVSQLGANVASRVSMSDLWFREPDRQLEGVDAYHSMLESIAGPLGGMVKNMYVGTQQFAEGHAERGIETMMPTFAKNAMKAMRFAHEGANTLRGDPIVPDVSTADQLVQALGFQPTKIAEQQRINSALMSYQKFIQNRRQALMNAFAMVTQAGDDGDRQDVLDRIRSFNAKYPEIAIRMGNLQASMRARAAHSAQSENGIMLQKKLAGRVKQEVGAMAGG